MTNCLFTSIMVWARTGYPIRMHTLNHFPWVHFFNVVEKRGRYNIVLTVKLQKDERDWILLFKGKLVKKAYKGWL